MLPHEKDLLETLNRAGKIKAKPFLRKIHDEWHRMISSWLPADATRVLEIGSGAGYLSEALPGVIASDVLPVPWVDVVLDGGRLPFRERSLDGVVMVNVMHHLPDLEAFFFELMRTLKPAGRLVCIEPWVNTAASIVWRWLHHEPYDIGAREWKLPSGGPLSMSNIALPWIALKRDSARFASLYPGLTVRHISATMPLAYLLSGGVRTSLGLPGFLYGAVRRIEESRSMRVMLPGMYALIVIEKNTEGS